MASAQAGIPVPPWGRRSQARALLVRVDVAENGGSPQNNAAHIAG